MGRIAGAENTRTTSETGNVGDTLCISSLGALSRLTHTDKDEI